MKKIIALEGLPCSGKTTFFHSLQKYNRKFNFIPELFLEAKPEDTPLTMRERYIKAEIQKVHNLQDLPTICDRSFISTLAFSYAKFKTFKDDSDYSFNLISLKNKRIKIPDHVIVFLVSPVCSINRRSPAKIDDSLPFWKNHEFLKHFSDYYFSADLHNILSENHITYIDSEGLDQDEVFKLAKECIDNVIDS